MHSTNLPYSFAKKHGIVIQPQLESERLEICYKPETSLESIAEVLRVLDTTVLNLKKLPLKHLNKLSRRYTTDRLPLIKTWWMKSVKN